MKATELLDEKELKEITYQLAAFGGVSIFKDADGYHSIKELERTIREEISWLKASRAIGNVGLYIAGGVVFLLSRDGMSLLEFSYEKETFYHKAN